MNVNTLLTEILPGVFLVLFGSVLIGVGLRISKLKNNVHDNISNTLGETFWKRLCNRMKGKVARESHDLEPASICKGFKEKVVTEKNGEVYTMVIPQRRIAGFIKNVYGR